MDRECCHPDDGILDIDFYAAEPTGIVLPMMSDITASLVINRDPVNYWGKGKPLAGARVHAATNSLETNTMQKTGSRA